ncbi:MAG: hypothetical protein A2Z78_01990 [Candidatus Nealsonbacteria bacterium RBG_13_36_15]|uniref:TraC-like domain-containing protein n=1 Tax=Candidatus Nealsonbacteria bacterium RBG_13_36_15 TaxID=1801660 RepID=A0A1G2DVE6_9BACT|nr:MAG: hypothetical protein A2Z78_01990 [Candidatus Nealsonbacteria bacterium RBG_13_36_15]
MPGATTQQFLAVEQMREGVIVLTNKALRGVLMVSSLNFALKSEDEQNATIYQFQNFLNSLDFPIQVLAHSRRLNITGYLEKIKELEKNQENELLKVQTGEYYNFIRSLVEAGTIMTKSFYVVVPFTIFESQGIKIPLQLLKSTRTPTLRDEEFQRYKSQLLQRMEFVALGLRRCGLQAIPLTTEELIELLWSLHHPRESEFGYYPEIPPELAI